MTKHDDVTVTLTAEDIKLYDRARAIGLPTIVVSMYGDRIKMLLAEEREACAEVAKEHAANYKPGGSLHTMMSMEITRAAAAACDHIAHLINERGQA